MSRSPSASEPPANLEVPRSDPTGPANSVRVLRTFFRNSLVREMQFRWNFLAEVASHAFWFSTQLLFFHLVFGNVRQINGWTSAEYHGFMATGMILNALMEAFFVPNLANLSELVRTGGLDFALLKPIDTQFLISFEKIDLGALFQLLLPLGLLGHAVATGGGSVSLAQVAAYAAFLLLALLFYYSLMLVFASTSVWLGRNQGLYEFWFYITIFARYPRDIYRGSWAADVLRFGFS
ncbi:MAG: ABC transporter permease, partial [Planctomycetaceae bacterium]